MLLYFNRNGSFEPYELPHRSRCTPKDIEDAIRKVAHSSGQVSTVSIRVGNEYIPITHVDEARVVSRMITADHDCFVNHLYEKGFPEEATKSKINQPQKDLYEEKELWKLEFDYEQNADLGTPCFGAAGLDPDDIF
jgi:hypothetical protein